MVMRLFHAAPASLQQLWAAKGSGVVPEVEEVDFQKGGGQNSIEDHVFNQDRIRGREAVAEKRAPQ